MASTQYQCFELKSEKYLEFSSENESDDTFIIRLFQLYFVYSVVHNIHTMYKNDVITMKVYKMSYGSTDYGRLDKSRFGATPVGLSSAFAFCSNNKINFNTDVLGPHIIDIKSL